MKAQSSLRFLFGTSQTDLKCYQSDDPLCTHPLTIGKCDRHPRVHSPPYYKRSGNRAEQSADACSDDCGIDTCIAIPFLHSRGSDEAARDSAERKSDEPTDEPMTASALRDLEVPDVRSP